MDAIGIATFSIGGFLTYAAIKGLHPWALFRQTLGASVPAPNSVAGSAPYTGPYGATATVQGQPVKLPSGVSVAGGGTGALHG